MKTNIRQRTLRALRLLWKWAQTLGEPTLRRTKRVLEVLNRLLEVVEKLLDVIERLLDLFDKFK